MVYNIVIVGYGEIARLAHHPVLLSRSDTNVVGLVDVNFTKDEVVSVAERVDASTHFKKAITSASTSTPKSNPLRFASISDVFHYFDGNIDAVCICTPKSVTLSAAVECLTHASASNALRGILLEKPPGECVEELQKVVQMATLRKVSIFTACHTTACTARVHCGAWLADKERRLKSINITWKENVRKWHPGQNWISTTSGGGVTDMLFNPLSLIVSQFGLEPKSIRLIRADLIRPCNWEAAVSGSAEFIITIRHRDGDYDAQAVDTDIPLYAEFAFDYEPLGNEDDGEAEEIWNIDYVAYGSVFTLTDGGSQAFIDSKRVTTEPTAEYPLRPEYEKLYDQFVDLLERNQGDAPSIVDRTTLGLLKAIVQNATYSVGPRFDF